MTIPQLYWQDKPRRSVLELNPRNFKSHHLWESDNLHALTAQVTSWKRNTRSKSKCWTFPQRDITSQGHKKQILKEIDGLILKIRKIKGMMILGRLYYNESVYIKLWVQNAPNLQISSKIREALVLFPPLPLPMLRCDFKVTWLNQHCKKGGKTTWNKNTSASRFLNEFKGLRYMYQVRSYVALSSLH